MSLKEITIKHYRSIENIKISFPQNKPVVLFGPNNAGKSNILSAINRLLGEKYPSYIEMLDSDYYMRDKEKYPVSSIAAEFTTPITLGKKLRKTITVTYNANEPGETQLHDSWGKIYASNEERAQFQSYLIDAERNIQLAFNYGSRYSLLSKFSHRIHSALNQTQKDNLTNAFNEIKKSFVSTAQFNSFFERFNSVLKDSVRGFVHSLEVDFSAYDPNNYAKALRIYAKEGDMVRGFEEFGTGEQQVLLMAFAKAYMQVFSSEKFLLIIEEPEAHLHPLAQKWLKENIQQMCRDGLQVIISTHSTSFIDASCLEGLVRVYKEEGTTKIKQISESELVSFCSSTGGLEEKLRSMGVAEFYSTKLFSDQLEGFFAEKIILVEGETEHFSLPVYFKKAKISLPEYGVEIINCRGKNSLPLLWRFFSAYGYKCFIIFDSDLEEEKNNKIFSGIISIENWESRLGKVVVSDNYCYFVKDYESFFKNSIPRYEELVADIRENYGISSKQGIAKTLAYRQEEVPFFIKEIISKFINKVD